jgi:hypothetical protein
MNEQWMMCMFFKHCIESKQGGEGGRFVGNRQKISNPIFFKKVISNIVKLKKDCCLI